MKKLLIIISIVLFLLALPLIFKSKSGPGLVGPDLSELEYTEITFKHTRNTFNLAGMLILPKGEGPFPTAVIIHGSGPSRGQGVKSLLDSYLKKLGDGIQELDNYS